MCFIRDHILIKDILTFHFLGLLSWNKLTIVFGSQNSSTRVLENNFLHQKWASENQALSTLRKSWTSIL